MVPTATIPAWLSEALGGSAPDASLGNFYQSNPAYQSEYNRVKGLGDQRNPLDWFKDFLAVSPQDVTKYNQFLTPPPPADSGSGFTDMIGAVFNTPSVTNGTETAPASVVGGGSVVDRFIAPTTETDNSGFFAQLSSMFTALFGQLAKPSTNLTVAPVTNTKVTNTANVDNSVTLNDSSVHNSGFSLDSITGFMARLPDLLSTPRGNDIVSPASPPLGYAQNFLQSGQRQSGQSIASITGLDVNANGVQLGATAIPWRTLIIGAVLSVGAFIAYKKFFK